MHILFFLPLLILAPVYFIACDSVQKQSSSLVSAEGITIAARFNVPQGFQRIQVNENSFAAYLRTLPLKPHGADVKLFDGVTKPKTVHEAVIDMDIGKKDLQQCADAVMRLRAEYLFAQKQFDKIHFSFTNGFRVDYSKWMEGFRIIVQGNETHWEKKAEPSNSYESFRKYLEWIFMYAGSLSLSRELVPVRVENMQIGDVFIQGGAPGHAVIVVDMAENPVSGEKLFLLAQSYMPAQETHILKNPDDAARSPWYSASFGEEFATAEWPSFSKNDLKRFGE